MTFDQYLKDMKNIKNVTMVDVHYFRAEYSLMMLGIYEQRPYTLTTLNNKLLDSIRDSCSDWNLSAHDLWWEE